MDFGYQPASHQLTNGADEEINNVDINIRQIIDPIKDTLTISQEIKECPYPNGCTSDLITYNGRSLYCPIFAMIQAVDDVHKCKYATLLLNNLKKHIKDCLIDRCGIPARHVYNFSKKIDTDKLEESMKYNYKDFLLLCGPTGTGKSFIAAYLCYQWCIRNYGYRFKDKTKWEEVADHINSVIRWYAAYEVTAATPQEQKEIARASSIMVIDDLGTEDNTPRSVAAINYIMSRRYDGGYATMITTNVSMADIGARYGRRLIDRLMESGRIIQCNEDMRRNKKWQGGQ